jgi:hypothetical protein
VLEAKVCKDVLVARKFGVLVPPAPVTFPVKSKLSARLIYSDCILSIAII